MMEESKQAIEKGKDNAINWLLHSGIDRGLEGCRSVYVPRDNRYYSWSGGDSCLLCTAGCVLVYLKYGFLERAIDSAFHIERLIIDGGKLKGAIRAGKNSSEIYSYYMSFCALAFSRLFKKTKEQKYLEYARQTAIWLIENMQDKDGKIICVKKAGRMSFRQILRSRFHTWEAVLVPILYELNEISPDFLFTKASGNLVAWLKKIMLFDGSFYCYSLPFSLRVLDYLYRGNPEVLLKGCSLRHPLSQSVPLEAFLLVKDIELAQKTFFWLKERLSENGLFYQFYFNNRQHSAEEDVMPTAYFGIILNRNKELFDSDAIIDKITRGISYAQVNDSPDIKSRGGFRGLPGHAQEGNNLYAWDTQYSLLFFHDLLYS